MVAIDNIDKNKPVRVTGASGYIVSWIVKDLLDQGFVVHGTVRDLNKASLLTPVRL